ncbi:hypothetical protein PInf_021520 [Phytophthora infestans]|nr:hypothetical protein PInf_021520 [Phytophthora infestans]
MDDLIDDAAVAVAHNVKTYRVETAELGLVQLTDVDNKREQDKSLLRVLHIFTGSSIGELGSDDESASDDDSADDGLGSPNLRGASPSMSLFGTPLPSGTDPPQPTSAESGSETPALLPSASASASLASSATRLLATAADVASPPAVSQEATSAAPPRLQSSSPLSSSQLSPSGSTHLESGSPTF